MRKYSVGDKFVIEIEEVFTGDICNLTPMLYRIKGFNSLVFDENGLDKLEQLKEPNPIHVEQTQECLMAQYECGLNDAWELARKISLNVEDGGISTEDLKRMFNIEHPFAPCYKIFKDFSLQEALSKIEAYEKEQAEIKVGDVVSHDGLKGVVTRVADDCIYTVSFVGTTPKYTASDIKKLTKTGKHIDISAILAEIGKE